MFDRISNQFLQWHESYNAPRYPTWNRYEFSDGFDRVLILLKTRIHEERIILFISHPDEYAYSSELSPYGPSGWGIGLHRLGHRYSQVIGLHNLATVEHFPARSQLETYLQWISTHLEDYLMEHML